MKTKSVFLLLIFMAVFTGCSFVAGVDGSTPTLGSVPSVTPFPSAPVPTPTAVPDAVTIVDKRGVDITFLNGRNTVVILDPRIGDKKAWILDSNNMSIMEGAYNVEGLALYNGEYSFEAINVITILEDESAWGVCLNLSEGVGILVQENGVMNQLSKFACFAFDYLDQKG